MFSPKGEAKPGLLPEEFRFAAIGLDHGHIYGMSQGLVEAGGKLEWVFDPDPAKVEAFRSRFPGVKVAPFGAGDFAGSRHPSRGRRGYPLGSLRIGASGHVAREGLFYG